MSSGGGNERAETNENKGPRKHPLPLDVRVRAQPEGPPSTRPHGREKKRRACTKGSAVTAAPPPGCAATKQRRAAIAAGAVCLARCERASRGSTSDTQISVLLLDFSMSGSASCFWALAGSDGRTSRKWLAKAVGCLESCAHNELPLEFTCAPLSFVSSSKYLLTSLVCAGVVGGLSPSGTRERRCAPPTRVRWRRRTPSCSSSTTCSPAHART